MSFARNFALGQQIAKNALDTYEDARLKRDLKPIMEGKAETVQQYNDPEQMQAMANAINPETGRPFYEFVDNGRGGLNLRSNFSYQGSDGNMVNPGGETAIFDRTRFLGRDFNRVLNDDEIDRERFRAAAGVIGSRDPMKGLQMRRELRQDEREDERFGWERQAQPLKQRAAELGVKKGEFEVGALEKADAWERGFGQALASYQGTPEQLETAIPFVNGSKSITLGDPNPETGLARMSVVKPDGRAVFLELTRHEQAQIFAAAQMMGQDPTRALGVLARVNKDLADAVARDNQLTGLVAGNTNDVASKGHKMRMDEAEGQRSQQRLANDTTRLNMERNPLKQKIETIEAATGKKLTEAEIKALGGLKIDEPGGLKFNKTDDGVVFTDQRTGNPVGKLDPALGLVPYGADPRQDQRLVQTLERAGAKLAVGQAPDGSPTWVYISRDGRPFGTPDLAINPPMRKEDVGDLQGLRTLLDQRRAQLAAAARSGDQRVIAPMAQEVQGLQRTLTAAARERFGDRADEYLSNR